MYRREFELGNRYMVDDLPDVEKANGEVHVQPGCGCRDRTDIRDIGAGVEAVVTS